MNRLTYTQIKQCLRVMDEIAKYKTSLCYARPVNPELDGCHDYYQVILNPMDLSTVRSKLENNKYHSISEWKSDVQLIWANSKTYNNSQSLYGLTAQYLQDKFQKMTKSITDDEISDWSKKLNNLQKKVKELMISAPTSLPQPYFTTAEIDEKRPQMMSRINVSLMANKKKFEPKRSKTNYIYPDSTYNNKFPYPGSPSNLPNESESYGVTTRSSSKKKASKYNSMSSFSQNNSHSQSFNNYSNNHTGYYQDNQQYADSQDELDEQEMNAIADEVNNLQDDEIIQEVFSLLKEKEPQLINSEDVNIEIQKLRPGTLRSLQNLLNKFRDNR
ncbi:hypothetical protein TRFO_38757 [Tritrichomonas foetus]|uniref:Bromo domain-containing protein n=1 Tax=Tritrichomonas foetus TaxID=1144522 RepID=A0A1J4J755_9EUKA|nr:hypothetical protein TRFO_38757 [Tritrichomonas foetus]|eukprot:OHS95062.1 hypothetical protein TRFO_38757 [Tritrichomonas foetus]